MLQYLQQTGATGDGYKLRFPFSLCWRDMSLCVIVFLFVWIQQLKSVAQALAKRKHFYNKWIVIFGLFMKTIVKQDALLGQFTLRVTFTDSHTLIYSNSSISLLALLLTQWGFRHKVHFGVQRAGAQYHPQLSLKIKNWTFWYWLQNSGIKTRLLLKGPTGRWDGQIRWRLEASICSINDKSLCGRVCQHLLFLFTVH